MRPLQIRIETAKKTILILTDRINQLRSQAHDLIETADVCANAIYETEERLARLEAELLEEQKAASTESEEQHG